jgi:hypothetical protein
LRKVKYDECSKYYPKNTPPVLKGREGVKLVKVNDNYISSQVAANAANAANPIKENNPINNQHDKAMMDWLNEMIKDDDQVSDNPIMSENLINTNKLIDDRLDELGNELIQEIESYNQPSGFVQ